MKYKVGDVLVPIHEVRNPNKLIIKEITTDLCHCRWPSGYVSAYDHRYLDNWFKLSESSKVKQILSHYDL